MSRRRQITPTNTVRMKDSGGHTFHSREKRQAKRDAQRATGYVRVRKKGLKMRDHNSGRDSDLGDVGKGKIS